MERICTNNAPAAIGPYSQAMAHGDLVFTSGQIPLDPATGALAGPDIRTQCEQVMKNLEAVLSAAGSGLDRVVKTTCFLTDMADFATFNEIYGRYFTEAPARSCFAVSALPKDALVEVEAVAVRG